MLFECGSCHEIDLSPQVCAQKLFQFHEPEETDWTVKYDEQIDIAVSATGALGERTEYTDLRYAILTTRYCATLPQNCWGLLENICFKADLNESCGDSDP